MAQLARRRPLAQRTVALEPFRLSPVLRAGTEAVSRSGINALHWELRGQAALIVTGNHTREQQTIVAEPRGASFACRTGDERDVAQKTAPAIGKTDADRCPAG